MRRVLFALAVTFLCALPGCAGGGSVPDMICSGDIASAYIAPDNIAATVGNQWTLSAFGGYDRSSGCVEPQGPQLVDAAWASSDPASVSVVAQAGTNKVTVTCLAVTANPVTISVTAPVNSTSKVTVTGMGHVSCTK